MRKIEEIDKAYYIREDELAILLAMAGQDELYGYPLRQMTGMGRADMGRLLFDMAGCRMLGVQGKRMQISREWQEIADGIASAEILIVSAEARQEYSERFLYVSNSPVVLHTQIHKGGMIRIERWECSDIAQRLIQHGIPPDSILPHTACTESGRIAPDIMQKLRDMAVRLFDKPLSEVLGEKGVLSAVGCYRTKAHRKTGQAVVCNQGIEDYLLVSDGAQSSVYGYSDKKLTEWINRWVRG